MRYLLILISVAMIEVGCSSHSDQPTDVRRTAMIHGVPVMIGNYTAADVKRVKSALEKVSFPAEQGTVARLLNPPLPKVTIESADWIPDAEKKGRIGGNVVEYWLNENWVIRVATAYYSVSDDHYSKEEWAVLLSKEARENFSRPIYPMAQPWGGKPNQ
jgi:hypothetical protein